MMHRNLLIVPWCFTMGFIFSSVRGQMIYPPVGNGVGMDPLVIAMDIMEQCEVDIDKLSEQVASTMMMDDDYLPNSSGNSNGPDDMFEAISELFPDFCADNQAKDFELVLNEFAVCSGFSLVQALETLGDGLLGGIMECTIAMIPVVKQAMSVIGDGEVMSHNPDFGIAIPVRCLDSFLGPHPLGDMLRTMFLKPEETMECFSDLGSKGRLPQCTYDRVWPVPLVGPILEKTACILGAATPLLEMAVKQELTTLQKCLPKAGETIGDCPMVPSKCTMMGLGFTADPQPPSALMALPKPLLGAPLPDVFDRVAGQENLKDAVEQYNQFVSQCVTDPWDGWYATTPPDYERPSQSKGGAAAAEKHPASVASQPEQGDDAVAETPAITSSQSSEARESKTTESGGGGGFWGGLLTGFCLMGAMWGYLIFRGQTPNPMASNTYVGSTPYQSVEMVPNDLTLS